MSDTHEQLKLLFSVYLLECEKFEDKGMPKVLISDKLSESAIEVFKENKVETSYMPGIEKDQLLKIIDQFDGLAIRSATKVTEEIFNKAKNLYNWLNYIRF